MKILITGGCGFVGANLALYFLDKGHKVTAMDNLVRRGGEFNLPLFKDKGITFIHGDIRCKEDFPKNDFDFVCECSAQPSAIDGYDNPYYDFSNNTLGLMNVLEYCRPNKTPLIFWSTNKVYSGDKVNAIEVIENETRYAWNKIGAMLVDPSCFLNQNEYEKFVEYQKKKNETFMIKRGDPHQSFQIIGKQYDLKGLSLADGISDAFSIDGGDHSIYGMSKIMSDLACQEYCQAFNIPVVVNRFSCLAGQRQWGKCAQGWVAWFAIAAHFGLPIEHIGWKGKQVRDVLFIDDLCNLIELEMANIDKIKGQVFNVGGGMKHTLSLIEATELMERKFDRKMVVKYNPIPRKADHCVYISDISKIKNAVGWEPKIGIEDGYDKIIEWVKKDEAILKGLYA